MELDRTAVIGILLVVIGCGAAAPTPAGAAIPEEKAMVGKVNAVRADHGLRALRSSSSLGASARRYAHWMLRADYFGHQQRIRASSRYSRLGENLAWHPGRRTRVRSTLRSWLSSAPHRALLLSRGFRWLGAGTARGRMGPRAGTTWVLHFGG